MLPFPLTQRLSLTVKVRKRGEGQLAANFEANIWRCTCFLLALFPRGRERMRSIRPPTGGISPATNDQPSGSRFSSTKRHVFM